MALSVTNLVGFGSKRAAAGGGSVTVDLPATTKATSQSGGTAFNSPAGWRFNSDGTVDERNGISYAYDHDWYTPNPGSAGADYEIYAQLNSGNDPGDTGAWLSLGSDREFSLNPGAGQTLTYNITIKIQPAGGDGAGDIIDTQTYTASATRS